MRRRLSAHLMAGVTLWLTMHSGALSQTEVDPARWSDERKEEFLQNADVIAMREIGTGVTRSRRAEMDDGMVSHDAHIQTVDEFRARVEGERGVELNFTDSYKYNIAAYRLDRLLGLRMVPVSVERRVAGDMAAVTWWVDNDMMMMTEFNEGGLQPPDSLAWAAQIMSIRFFTELVYNTDANSGNFVIDDDWAIHMIDFTRSFRINDTLREPENIANIRLPREVFDAARALDFRTLDSVMDNLLTDRQIRALLARRDLIVETLEAQIERRGGAGALQE